MMKTGKTWTRMGSLVASLMFVGGMIHQNSPYFSHILKRYIKKLESACYPYIEITFNEHSSGQLSENCNAFVAIQHYLEANSSHTVKRLKAGSITGGQTLVLSMDDDEETTDEYHGIKLWWSSNTKEVSISRSQHYKQRCYTLVFHSRYRDLISNSYLQHVIAEGKAISLRNRRRKLYTNKRQTPSPARWFSVVFQHPATFETLALKPETKKDIMDDLITFSKAKDYYMKIGKAWKRGYLLFGPPGTGKSTMIAAMANLLQYDVYDLELTSVTDNTELKKLIIETRGKSIIVIEDIDCSLNLTGKRDKAKVGQNEEKENQLTSQVTLSGVLNSIDGLWSACANERIIVFTSNHVSNLDPALIRRGRMDKLIELSYCSFEAFKVLAKNYLGIVSHELFGRVEKLLGETNTSPADVAENLMPTSADDDGETCLKCLISVLEDAKKAAMSKAKGKKRQDETSGRVISSCSQG